MTEDNEKQGAQAFEDAPGGDWFAERLRFDTEAETEADEAYKSFADKFKPKLTTDDCYTPDEVYDAVADYVARRYHLDRSNFVRPFYPGGDYKKAAYAPESVVVDNPPFSILAEIVDFYQSRKIGFFLFAPALTLTNYAMKCTCLCTGNGITYENGASISTSFLTNLEDYEKACMMSAPELYEVVDDANRRVLKGMRKQQPKYFYPWNIATAALIQKYSKYGVEYAIPRKRCIKIGTLDAQRPYGKSIFGGGLLLSPRAAAERAAAERAAAERAAAERAAAERAAATTWELSPREQFFVDYLSRYDEDDDDDGKI